MRLAAAIACASLLGQALATPLLPLPLVPPAHFNPLCTQDYVLKPFLDPLLNAIASSFCLSFIAPATKTISSTIISTSTQPSITGTVQTIFSTFITTTTSTTTTTLPTLYVSTTVISTVQTTITTVIQVQLSDPTTTISTTNVLSGPTVTTTTTATTGITGPPGLLSPTFMRKRNVLNLWPGIAAPLLSSACSCIVTPTTPTKVVLVTRTSIVTSTKVSTSALGLVVTATSTASTTISTTPTPVTVTSTSFTTSVSLSTTTTTLAPTMTDKSIVLFSSTLTATATYVSEVVLASGVPFIGNARSNAFFAGASIFTPGSTQSTVNLCQQQCEILAGCKSFYLIPPESGGEIACFYSAESVTTLISSASGTDSLVGYDLAALPTIGFVACPPSIGGTTPPYCGVYANDGDLPGVSIIGFFAFPNTTPASQYVFQELCINFPGCQYFFGFTPATSYFVAGSLQCPTPQDCQGTVAGGIYDIACRNFAPATCL